MVNQVSLNGRRMVTCGALVSYPGRFSLVITNLEARRVPVVDREGFVFDCQSEKERPHETTVQIIPQYSIQ